MSGKRKQAGDYSTNPHTKKARDRVANMTAQQKEVHKARDRLTKAIGRKLKELRSSPEYISANAAVQEKLEKDCRDAINQKYRQLGTHPDQVAQNHGILSKEDNADWMSDDLNEDDVRQIEEQEIAQYYPEHVSRSYDLIKGTMDLHQKDAPAKAWEATVTRMMAGYYPKAMNKDTFTLTVQDIVEVLQKIHAGQNYPDDLVYLKSGDSLEDHLRSLNSTQEQAWGDLVAKRRLNAFQDYWEGALQTLYLKLWYIQYQPRRAVLYFTACQVFLQLYPNEAQWSFEDVFSTQDAKKNEVLFKRIFQNLLNEARTMDYLGTNWENITEDDRVHVGVDQKPYIVYLPNIWEILTLPEAIIWRELLRTKTWLPKKPHMTEKQKQERKAKQPKNIREQHADMSSYFFTRSLCFGGGEMIDNGSSPFFSRALLLGSRRKRVVPHLWRAKYSPRTQIKSVRNFGILQSIQWAQYKAFTTKSPTILAPHPLPSRHNCMLGLQAALGREDLVQLVPRMSFYEGEVDDLRLDGERLFLRDEDGMPDSRLSCQVALLDPEIE